MQLLTVRNGMLPHGFGGELILAAFYLPCLDLKALLAYFPAWNYCLLALPTKEGGNKGSNIEATHTDDPLECNLQCVCYDDWYTNHRMRLERCVLIRKDHIKKKKMSMVIVLD